MAVTLVGIKYPDGSPVVISSRLEDYKKAFTNFMDITDFYIDLLEKHASRTQMIQAIKNFKEAKYILDQFSEQAMYLKLIEG